MTRTKKIAIICKMNIKNTCPFFKICGGCLYQDMPEEDYIQKKENFIRRAFQDYGLQISLEPILSVPLYSRRRACFAYEKGKLGYNALKSHKIVEITDCLLLKQTITSFLPTLRSWIKTLGGIGDVFILDTPYGLDIHIKPKKTEPLSLTKRETLAQMGNNEQIVRLIYNQEPIVSKAHLPIWPDAFLQPSQEGEDLLVRLMLSYIKDEKKAVDLFCGSGTFTNPLLKKGIKVTGYDCATDSVNLLGQNGVVRDLFRSPLLPEELKGLDLVVLDPPRSGARLQTEQIAQTSIPKIIMISCNPQTAVRDIKILIDNGWHLKQVTPVDQFKWSNHIELVCLLER